MSSPQIKLPARLITAFGITAFGRRGLLLLGACGVLASCLAIRNYLGPERASAKPPVAQLPVRRASAEVAEPARATNTTTTTTRQPQQRPAEAQKPPVVAVVNQEPVTREELAQECLRHYGKEVLEAVINKRLIMDYCQSHKVTVTQQEVEDEIDRMSRKFSLPKDQWLKMLEKERGIKPKQYAQDIVWPTLALRKLAAKQLTVSTKEIDEAFESQFGPAVKARLIVLENETKAKAVRAQAVARPEEFGALARKNSQDPNSASANGLIQPIRKHLGDPALEKVAFSLKEGEISPIVKVANQYVILKCDGQLTSTPTKRDQVEKLLEDAIRERKLRTAGSEIMKKIQDEIQVENVLNDPAKSKAMPGVAALLNGQKIMSRELSEECIERHGVEVLEGALNRRLIEQALKKQKLAVTDKEVDAEISRAAVAMGMVKKNGEADLEQWIKSVTREQNVTVELYKRDAVWPSVALKKLVGDNVKISEEDLKKGYEANYGKRVRCKAIVCSNQRKAQEVWEKARDNPSKDYFGRLAEEYSVEAYSRSLKGEIPPIQRHGGQPMLEREAFQLKEGDLSGVIQTGETFVVLLCEGYTDPVKVEYKSVRDALYEDIHEKKLRIAMGKAFSELQDNAQIDNFLAGSIKMPKKLEAAETPTVTLPKMMRK